MRSVSVVIPSYNQGRYVAGTIDSVLAQTYPQVEVIVVDDGSTDDTRERLKPYAGRIQYFSQTNRGLSGARNAGFAAASGDCILFLDSDDLLLPAAVEKLVAVLNQNTSAGLAYCAWQQISADGMSILGEVHPGFSGHVLKSLLLREFFFFGSSALIRRAVLEQVGLFDETLPWGDDADMWLRIARAGYAFSYLDEAVLQYRVHSASMTAGVSANQIEGWQAGLRKFFGADDLPDDVRVLQPQAYAVLYFETAGRYFRGSEVEAGRDYLHKALEAGGAPSVDWFLNWLAGTAFDPRTPDPQVFIDRVFAHLPSQAAALRTLHRRAIGRYHIAAAFAAYHSKDYARAQRHVWPALLSDPRCLTNKGFLKVAATACLRAGIDP